MNSKQRILTALDVQQPDRVPVWGHAINDAAPDGRDILCSSNSIHPGVKPENFLAMIRAAKEHGGYAVVELGGMSGERWEQ